ncbi:MAG: carbohydrate ABC transporter permease [Clostridia bacterium]|nr:carbohydrate ABC transporter permease [Clostridia bacterium]
MSSKAATLLERIKFERRSRKKVMLSRSKAGNFGVFIFLLAISLFMILPMVYSVVQSLKPIDEIFAFPPRFFVRHPTFDNYKQLFKLADNLWVPFSRYLFNSVIISTVGTTLYMVIATMAAYPLAKAKTTTMYIISQAIVMAMLFRGDTTAIPQYIIIAKLGMVDTYYAMILPTLASTMGVYLIRQFIVTAIPDETLEAARIDGAGEYRIFFQIIIPSVKPALLTLVIFTFQTMWNSTGTQYIFSEELKQLPSVLSSISAGGLARSGASAAVSVVMMIPPIAVFLISQSSVMETMTHSGLK